MIQLITKLSEIGNLINDLAETAEVGFDTEASTLEPLSAFWTAVQIKANKNIYVIDPRKFSKKELIYLMQLISTKTLIGHNIKYDIEIVYCNTGVLLTNVYDTFTNEIIINNIDDYDRYPSLQDLCKNYLNVELKKEVRNSFIDNPDVELTNEILYYCAEDVNYLSEIKEKQLETLTKQKQLYTSDLENRVLPVFASMELNGVLLNEEQWNSVKIDAETKAEELRKVILELIFNKIKDNKFNNVAEAFDALFIKITTKKDRLFLESITDLEFIRTYILDKFNLDSPKQMLNILKNYFGVPLDNSTNEKIINKYVTNYPIINRLIAYREQVKQASSFGEGFIQKISKVDGRIHTNYNAVGAVSGRPSSDKPNMCNLPKDNKIRNCFIAREGYKIVAGDFNQEEYRLMGTFEPKMADAFAKGIDMHTKTTAELYDIPVEEVTKDLRKKGKTYNFAVGYGSTEYGLYKNFDVPMEEGKKFLDKFYNVVYTSLRDVKIAVGEFAWKNGYVKTLGGRKRFFNIPLSFQDRNDMDRRRSKIEREAFNHMIQGTGADVLKESLCDVYYDNPFGSEFRILLQVYDEIVCEVREDLAEEAEQYLKTQMEKNLQKYLGNKVKAVVDTSVTDCWTKD
jgi:DNA polymerase I